MKKFIWLLCLVLFFTKNIFASTPLWTFKPLSPTTITILPFQIKYIDYLITNESFTTHTLSIQPYPFEITKLEPLSCGETFTLNPNESCILNVLIKGFSIVDSFTGGPILCEAESELMCYTPSQKDILTVIFRERPTPPPPSEISNGF